MDVNTLFRTASMHHQAGRTGDAESGYREVLRLQPDHADALHLLGLTLAQTGRPDEALPLLARAAKLAADRPDIHANRGEALRQAGHLTAAEASFRRAIALAPFFPEAHYNLGNVLKGQGRHAEAIASYTEAIRLRPDYPRALFNLGNALRAEGRAVAAVDAYRRALALKVDWGEAHLNLANALFELRDLDAAAEHYGLAATGNPDDPALAESLGCVYLAQGRIADAVGCLRQALARRPDPLKELRLAALTPPIAESKEAIDAYRGRLTASLTALTARHFIADSAVLHSSGAEPPLLLAYQGRGDRPLKEQYAALFTDALPKVDPPPRRTSRLPRIGVVVTHGHEGVFARCLGEIIARLDHRHLTVSIICQRSAANVLRHMMPNSGLDYFLTHERVDETAAAIRTAGFELLYYWEVGTDSMNYFLPYYCPARVQLAGWGWPVTTGIPVVAWYVSAADLEPPGADGHYSEKLKRLPSLPTYYLRPPVPGKPADRGRFGVRTSERLYLCQQNLRKLHPDFDPVLRNILQVDPGGRIVLIADEQPRITEMLMARLRQSMPDVISRIAMAPRMERVEYLGLMMAADAILDTLYYGGGANTVYDAAACGTPTVTLPGQFHRGRWAAAVNRRLGVPELTVGTAADYVKIAVRVAGDTDLRRDLNRRMLAAAGDLFEDGHAVAELQEFFLTAAS